MLGSYIGEKFYLYISYRLTAASNGELIMWVFTRDLEDFLSGSTTEHENNTAKKKEKCIHR